VADEGIGPNFFDALHESAYGTNATYGPRRPMSGVGSRTDFNADVAFGPFMTPNGHVPNPFGDQRSI
jgi:hypothetical protein